MENLYNKASLVMTPQMVETGKVYSMKPEDRKGDFTFSRATYATRVNEQGKIEKETQNLLVQSNQFDTTWSGGASVLGGQSGYDGLNNAWSISKNGNAFDRITQLINNSGVATFSLYAKAGTLNFILIHIEDSIGDCLANFNLSTGTLGSLTNGITSKIEDAGNGWYRCIVSFSRNITDVRIFPSESGGYTGTTGNIYVQDAQLEQGLVARDYIETTTAAIYGGITDNVPRLDYTDSSCPALLLEPQRTNSFKFSEYASGNRLVGPPTITENYAESPEGLNNAFRIQDTTGTSFMRIAESSGGLSVSVNSTYTQSLFVKKATSAVSSYGGVGFDYSGGTRQISYIIFDEYNGTMTALQSQSTLTLHDAEDYGDYWRFSISAKDTGGNTNLSLNVYACLSGNGTSVSTGTKDWTGYGLQLEEGSYATSYIPTYGSAVTRNVDSQTLDITNFVSATEGTLFFELKDAKSHSATNKILGIGDGSGVDNFFGLYVSNFATGAVGIRNRQANADLMNTAIPNPQNAKVAIKFGADGVKTFLNGSEFQSSATAYTGWATSFDLNTSFGDVDLKQYLLFPTALTDQEAIDLTTL